MDGAYLWSRVSIIWIVGKVSRCGPLHQELEKPSAIIAGCGVYNWAANCDPAPLILIPFEIFSASLSSVRFEPHPGFSFLLQRELL